MNNKNSNGKITINPDALVQDVASIGEAIQFAIKLSNRKQKEVAQFLSISESAFSEILNNKREFRAGWIKSFCQFVDNNFLIEWVCFDMGLTKPLERGEELTNTEKRLNDLEARQRKTDALLSEIQAAFNKFQLEDS